MKKLFGLGKGLNSLIPAGGVHVKPDIAKENVFYVEVHKIRPNPDQPRKDFDKEAISELAKSIRKFGVLQPLLVSKVEEDTQRGRNVFYQLIAGERRLRASQEAGLPHVPVIIRDDMPLEGGDKSQRLEMALIENIQRENLNPMEEAEAYERLQKEFGLTQQEIADKVSKSRVAVTNIIRLQKLPNYLKDALRHGRISYAHGRALLAIEDDGKQKEVYNQILTGGLSTKDVEAAAASSKSLAGKGTKDHKYIDLEKNLTTHLKAPVLIKAKEGSGQIVIRFANHEELNTIAKNIIE
jgi:ParB family chromosome partitioning protein